MPSTFPNTPDDLGRANLTHGDVTDALAAVETAVSGILAAPGVTILTGNGPPPSGSGLSALNGVNDPWRWFPRTGVWVSPPVDVTWSAGATTTAFAAPSAGAWALYVDTTVTPLNTPGDFVFASNGTFGSNGVIVGTPAEPQTVSAGGSARAYLTWDFNSFVTGPPSLYQADATDVLPADSRAIADILGPDFTVTGPSEWSEDSVGSRGDYYYDQLTGDFYGPRGDDGSWPFLATFGMNPNTDQNVFGSWLFVQPPILPSPDGTRYSLVVSNDGTLGTEPL